MRQLPIVTVDLLRDATWRSPLLQLQQTVFGLWLFLVDMRAVCALFFRFTLRAVWSFLTTTTGASAVVVGKRAFVRDGLALPRMDGITPADDSAQGLDESSLLSHCFQPVTRHADGRGRDRLRQRSRHNRRRNRRRKPSEDERAA
ncbi:hypothetical protein [Cupriavidus sp. YR651]|uniref:hypothetical protein n=1 Tax=Cupriavidus sp. YR651 TaxID=1855315 RepID=UPI002101663C|nr:hypothetical protein [Cupriavidus sp. YR651]